MDTRKKTGLMSLIAGLICVISGLLYNVVYNWNENTYGWLWLFTIIIGIIQIIIGIVCMVWSISKKCPTPNKKKITKKEKK